MASFASAGYGLSVTRAVPSMVCESSDRYAVLSHRRVLLVDDDVVSLETWALLLADAGVQVQVAPGTAACLRMLGQRDFDLIFIDLKLGDDNGLEVMRQVRARGLDVPFILATVHASTA